MTLDVDYLAKYLVGTAGGYLSNVIRGEGLCTVCSTPVDDGYQYCVHCNRHRQLPYASSLADAVVPLSYAGHNRQSGRLVYGYKSPLLVGSATGDDVSAHRVTMSLVLFLGFALHRACIESTAGPIETLVVVPSTRGRGDHPLAGLVGPIALEQGLPQETVSYVGPIGDTSRDVHPERWLIPAPARIVGRHVVVIDDSWVTGRHPQSVAAALKRDGARAVTVVVAARLLEPSWPATKSFLARGPLPDYDPHSCPVNPGGACRP